jgi:hypothetical protein
LQPSDFLRGLLVIVTLLDKPLIGSPQFFQAIGKGVLLVAKLADVRDGMVCQEAEDVFAKGLHAVVLPANLHEFKLGDSASPSVEGSTGVVRVKFPPQDNAGVLIDLVGVGVIHGQRQDELVNAARMLRKKPHEFILGMLRF